MINTYRNGEGLIVGDVVFFFTENDLTRVMVPVALLISKNPSSEGSSATSPYVSREFSFKSTSSAAMRITNLLTAMSRGTDASYDTCNDTFQLHYITLHYITLHYIQNYYTILTILLRYYK